MALPPAAGASDQEVGGGILRIALPKGRQADCASLDECTLVRAAEATLRGGGTHFMLLPGHGGATQSGYAYIKAFTIDAGESLPNNVLSVEEVLYFYRKA
jgi:hypothetical protein